MLCELIKKSSAFVHAPECITLCLTFHVTTSTHRTKCSLSKSITFLFFFLDYFCFFSKSFSLHSEHKSKCVFPLWSPQHDWEFSYFASRFYHLISTMGWKMGNFTLLEGFSFESFEKSSQWKFVMCFSTCNSLKFVFVIS